MYCTIATSALLGLHSVVVQVEVSVSNGLPYCEMVGNLSGEVREGKERVKVALMNSGITLPPKRITINLAPANLRKEGNGYDLPIAIGILGALGEVSSEALKGKVFLGEVGLNGELKGIRGVLPMILQLKEKGYQEFVIPKKNLGETQMIYGCSIVGMSDLKSVLVYLKKQEKGSSYTQKSILQKEQLFKNMDHTQQEIDFLDIAGQETVKRAVEIAAAGFHNLLMVGPPGAGKSMIANRISTILPPITMEESMEVSQIYSVKGLLNEDMPYITKRPFLNPHHTISAQALAGGGRTPQPGVVSLAHRGVLFLDELPEFQRSVLEILRQPMEEKTIQIARMQGNYTYPADFMLVGAMNPCPCGYYPDYNRCNCKEQEVKRYQNKVSGPLLDRMDLSVVAMPVTIQQLSDKKERTSSHMIRNRVMKARAIQEKRYEGSGIRFNAQLNASKVETYCALMDTDNAFLADFFQKMQLSARAYYRLLKVARTIADLEGVAEIRRTHLMEAICYRMDGGK
ncbi:MAG: YifB family Mg chelatase-like AAA ATPase [Eubacteriales bacterium]